jgi:glycosyltransferase involved in cell wall biosynthesis
MNWSVIIPMGRPERAGITLRSLAEQDFFPPSWEILLVGVKAQAVAEKFAELPIVALPLEKNELPPKTRLIGSDRAKAEWFIFVDDDMELAPDFFKRLHAIINTGADGGKVPDAIGAKLPGVKNNFSDRLTNLSNFWSQQGDRPGPRPWL